MTLGSHQKTIGTSQTHITPRWIIEALGPFDLDPAGAGQAPWRCATTTISPPHNGLALPWAGFVWLNPPFDRRHVHEWVSKLAHHNNGIALLHARTETKWFQPCWSRASGILFLRHRVIFHKPDGSQQTTKKGEVANSGAPVCLVGFGVLARTRLENSGLEGSLVTQWKNIGSPASRRVDNPKRSD